MMEFRLGCRSHDRLRLIAGVAPSVHTVPSGPTSAAAWWTGAMVMDLSDIKHEQNVDCAMFACNIYFQIRVRYSTVKRIVGLYEAMPDTTDKS